MNHRLADRLTSPDFLKGIAVLCMIQVHLMELFATYDIYDSFSGKISLFLGGVPAAPVFMVVMGYFAIRARQTGKSIMRGLKILLLGLALNIGLNAHLLLKIFHNSIELNPFHYFFGVDILFLAGLSIISIALLKRLISENIIFWIIFSVFVASANTFLPDYQGQYAWVYYVQALFWGNLEWSYFPVFPWMVYPILGVIYYFIEIRFNSSVIKGLQSNLLLAGFAVLNILFVKYGFAITTDLPAYYHHTALFVLWAVLFMGFWLLLFKRLYKYIADYKAIHYVVWAGENVTAFYVVQWLLIGNIATAIYRTQSWPMLFVWFVAIVLVSTFVVKAWVAIRKK
jgi:hypothetical protein